MAHSFNLYTWET